MDDGRPLWSSPTLTTSFLKDSYSTSTVQELLGHKDVKTTTIYTLVLSRGGKGVSGPLADISDAVGMVRIEGAF